MKRVTWFRSIRTKLVLVSVIIEALMLALLIGNAMRLIQSNLEHQLQVRIDAIEQAYKTSLAVPLASRDYATLRDIIEGWRASEDVLYMQVADPMGQILVNSGNSALLDNQLSFHAIKHVKFTVDFQGQVYGIVQYGLSTTYIDAARSALFTQGALIAFAELGLSFLLLLFSGYWLTRHLIRLSEATAEVAKGNYSVQLTRKGQDEVAMLTDHFNEMTRAVCTQIETLREKEERFRAIADYTYAWESWFNAKGQLEWVNPAVERLTGYSPEECLHLPDFPIPLIVPEDCDLLRQQHRQALEGHTGQDLEFRVHCKDGRTIWVAMAWQPIFDTAGQSLGYRSSIRDITLQHYAAQELAYHASHDPLTGLHNRRSFEDELQHILNAGVQVVVVYLDLDQFKTVNDACGHIAGDSLLRHLARQMQSKFAFGYLARLGGDEFGLLMQGCTLEEAVRRSQRMIDDIRAMPFNWEGKLFRLGASIGIVKSDAELKTVTDLLIAADTACYAAKERGRNRVQVFSRSDDYFKARHAEILSLPEITAALQQERMLLFYQEILPLKPEDPRHLEILIRMRSETGEIVSPAYFIPAAERYNMMALIDRWVFEKTCYFMSEWQKKGLSPLPHVGINLSGATLADEGLLAFIRDTLDRYRVNPAHICFEITESCAISQLEKAFEFIHFVHDLGATLALDDFGSGLSSFGYLKQFKVDYLKIDGMFVKGLDKDASDRAVVDSMVRVAQAHGLKTIAEFVGNQAVLEWVKELGVDYAQGYAVHVPEALPLELVLK